VTAAFHLRESAPPHEREALLAALDSITEVFPSSVDPLDDFEGYAVRQLVLAIAERLREER
jgi:hypothetical protein